VKGAVREILIRLARWWNGWAYEPKHSNRAYWLDELPREFL
jgi:hypothetical protein